MEVILKQDVNKLGRAGSIVKVKDGFAHNYLIPNRLAVPVTPGNLKALKEEEQKRSAQLEKARKESEELKERLSKISLTIAALSQEEDKIFGSVSAPDIAKALKEEGIEIDKSSIILDEPIKSLGIYEVPIKLHAEVQTKIKVWIVKK